jgi:hypothetical protein
MIAYQFHSEAEQLLRKAQTLGTQARIERYVGDVPHRPAQAEYDMELAAEVLESAASDLRIALERIRQVRADRTEAA